MIAFERGELNADQVPMVWQITRGNQAGVDQICDWLAGQRPEIEAVLLSRGGILVRGFEALSSAVEFERVLAVLAPKLMDYVGGTSPRRSIRGNIMTATEVPPTYSIPLHQEMSYTDDHPERISFFCETPPTEGGATTVADMRQVLRRIDPEVRARWTERGVQLRRTLPSERSLDKKPGVPKTWNEVFATASRDEVDRVAAEKGWRTTWLDDDSVQLWQEIRPATKRHPATGEEVWFNQAHIFAPSTTLAWARKDGRLDQWERLNRASQENPEMLDQVFHADGEPIRDADVMHVYDVLAASALPVFWRRGDLLLLDNTLAGHGRTAFSGERLILTALIREPAAAVTAARQQPVAAAS